MLILAKTALAMMLGFIFAIITGIIAIPLLKKINFILLYSFLGISFTVVNFRRQIILESKKRS